MEFKKEVDYNTNKNDFVAECEITVTITLSEYRELVTVKATNDRMIAEANSDKYERDSENNKLKKENSELKGKLYDLKEKIDELTQELEKTKEGSEENED